MSDHGRLDVHDEAMPPGIRSAKAVSHHTGSPRDFLHRHRGHAEHVLPRGREGLLEIVPHLLHRISDERTLVLAWEHLARYGGQAPGPDGERYGDSDESQKWRRCRELRDEIRSGEYTPGEEYLRHIPKNSGKGMRPLILQNIEDRVVQRAAVEILQPLLDPRFDQLSFGFRPGRGTLAALAWAERLAIDEKRWVWVAADIRDAFCNVPVPRLLDVVRKRLVDEDLFRFVENVLKGAKMPGLRQGGPLSPLLLNLYLDHLLDRKWRKLHPDIPLIRYADDILILCRSRKEAAAAYNALAKLLRPTGMTVKEDLVTAVRRLDLGEKAHYMGFEIGKGDGRMRLGLAREVWDGLGENLEKCHEAPASAMRAVQCVVGWLSQRAACFPDLGIEAVYARVQKIARQYAFDELLCPYEAKELADEAIGRWEEIRRAARAAYVTEAT